MSGTNILYVVIHGLISLVDLGKNKNEFTAYLLDMGDKHAYLFGNWLFEDAIAPHDNKFLFEASLTIEPSPLNPGVNSLNANSNIVVQLPEPPQATDQVRGIIHLPRPQKISFDSMGTLLDGSLTGADLDKILPRPDQVANTRIFEYAFDDFNGVALVAPDGTHLWDCPPPEELAIISGGQHVAVLHIFDEPAKRFDDLQAGQAHSIEEFNKSFKVLKVDLEMKQAPQRPVRNGTVPAGLYSEEVSALELRDRVVLELMAQVRGSFDPGGGTAFQVCSPAHAIVV